MKSGDVLNGRFEIEELAGVGGMGEVHRARDRETGQPVAVKLVLRRGAAELARFDREAQVLASLDHASIVRYLGEVRDEHGGYIVMEWLDGESLSARLARARLTLGESVALASRVAEGLAHAHGHGVVHRDLKPSNLLLVGGALDGVKIIDFGLARTAETGSGVTASHATLGTPGFMAPEQAASPRDVDARADVYSLGCVLFRCLAGRPPHDAQHPFGMLLAASADDAPRLSTLVDGVPPALDDLVAGMIARDPAARPNDVGAQLTAIAADLQAQHIGYRVPTARPELAPPESAGTLSAASPAGDAARAWRPTPTTPGPIGITADAGVDVGASPSSGAKPGSIEVKPSAAPPPVDSTPRASAPAEAAKERPRMHPATAALLTIVAIVTLLGACGSGCLYCTCLRGNVQPGAATKDAGRPAPPRPTATATTTPRRAPTH